MIFLITSSLLGSINIIVTIVQLRAKGLTWMRLPFFVWTQLVTSFLLVLAFPPLEAAGIFQLMDRLVGTSFFSTIVGILYVARVSSGNSTVGEGMEFDVIAAVVVGGTALGGAVGRMTGTFLGVLFIAMIGNGLIHWGIDPDLNKVVRGIIIFLAVVINSNLSLKKHAGPKED